MKNLKPLSNSKLAPLAVLLGLLIPQVSAQNDSPPTGQPVRPLPENAEWTIAVTALEPGKSNPNARLTEMRGQRTKSLRHDVYLYGEGKSERWIAGHFLLETFPGDNVVVPTPYPRDPTEFEKRLGTFPELDWVSPPHYQGIEERDGIKCRLYARTLVVKPEIDGEIRDAVASGKIEMPTDIIYSYKAWIDTATNWPIAFEGLGYRYEYQISVPKKKVSLALPSRFTQAALEIDPNFSP